LDYSLTYAYTFDRLPTYYDSRTESVDPVMQKATVRLAPVYNRIQIIGVDGVIVVSGVGIRGELVNTITNDRLGRDSLIDNPYLRVNLGLDYNVSRIISDWDLFTKFNLPGSGLSAAAILCVVSIFLFWAYICCHALKDLLLLPVPVKC
jgi:hypothetical protein